jgi:DNA-binding beta-propeller fold protein YncE
MRNVKQSTGRVSKTWLRGRALAVLSVLGAALLAASAFSAIPAFAVRGHVFEGSFGSTGSGPGQLSTPAGVAVNEASGDVYVVDAGNDRVEVFDRAGKYVSQITGPSGTGTGKLTSGSKTIDSVTAGGGAFAVGEEISAPGLPGGTTITGVGSGSLELSQAATASETAALTAHQAFGLAKLPYGVQWESSGVAVDNTCHLRGLSGSACAAEDPSNGDVYVLDKNNSVIDKFSSEGVFIGQITEVPCRVASGCEQFGGEVVPFGGLFRFELLDGVAVDGKGGLWVFEDHGFSRAVYRLDDAVANRYVSSPIAVTGVHPAVAMLAVGCGDRLFVGQKVANAGERVAEWNSEGALLSEEVDGEESFGVAAEPVSCDVYVDNVTSVGRFTGDVPPLELERFGAGHLVEGSGVGVDESRSTVYVADAAANVVDVFGPEPAKAPTVEHEAVSGVTADSAVVEAEVNPRGEAASYWFEYGVCTGVSVCVSSPYEARQPQPAGSAGSGFEPELVSVDLPGLSAGTTYHVRAVAEGRLGTARGQELTFTTQGVGVLGLPDGRVWELVSPPDKRGATFASNFQGEFANVAASGGGGMAFMMYAPTEAGPAGFASRIEVLSTRGRDGWVSRDLGVPHSVPTNEPVGNGYEYKFFSPDLSVAAVHPFGPLDPQVSEEASEQTALLHTDYLNGNSGEPCVSGCYRPLVTGCPAEGSCPPKVQEHANVPPGIRFGQCEKQGSFFCGPEVEGASPDLAHVVLSSKVALTETAVENGLYEWSAGKLRLVSVLPPSEGGKAVKGELGSGSKDRLAAAVSSDGSRVVWAHEFGMGKRGLYLYDGAVGEEGVTVRLDRVRGGSGTGSVAPLFQAASSDGSRVFFTDEQRLKSDSGATSGQADLYECRIVESEPGEPECELSDLTPLNGTEPASVQGSVLGASADGSRVYFVAKGVLAVNSNAAGETATAGDYNLYVSDNGVSNFMTTLSSSDRLDWLGGPVPAAYESTARVSANGQWVAFMSQRSLTGYDNRDAHSGKPDEEVYLYDAEAERLVCASCTPTGARPTGTEYSRAPSAPGALDFGEDGIWQQRQWLAASIPGWTLPQYQSRYLDNTGRLFFNTRDALVPQDVDGTWDVYEYEPPGVPAGPHECTTASPMYSERSGGCVSLISAGRSPEDSAFLDASETGGDVFFVTGEKLVPQDFDTSLDIYDAHECSASSPCVTAPASEPSPCHVEASEASCRPAQTPQLAIFGAPASATFNAPPSPQVGGVPAKPVPRGLAVSRKLAGALRACLKERNKRKRVACERRVGKRYGARSRARKSTGRGR